MAEAPEATDVTSSANVPDGPDAVSEQLANPIDHGTLRRLAVTIGLASLALGAFHIPLPGLDVSVLASPDFDFKNLSVGALGVNPVLSAFVVVELVSLLRARWRRLRVSGPDARAKMTRIAYGLALSLALIQAYGVVVYLEGLDAYGLSLVEQPGWGFQLVAIASLAGGTGFLIAIALTIERFGIGNGFSVLIAFGACLDLSKVVGQAIELAPVPRLEVFALLVAIIALTALLLPSRLAINEPIVRPLPCGIVPLATSIQLFMLPGAIAMLAVGADLSTLLMRGGDLYTLTGALAVIAFTLLFSRLFHAPQRIARLRARVLGKHARGADAQSARAALIPQIILAILMLLPLWWADAWLGQTVKLGSLAALDALVISAVTLDLAHELRARRTLERAVPIWAIHRVYAVSVALELLRREGVAAQPRTLYHRTLLQFFGPYLPITLLVPERDAKRAAKLLAMLAKTSGR